MDRRIHLRNAFTVVELLAVVAIIGILVALLLPSVQSAREGARRISCSKNLMNVAIAVRSYQAAFGHYPVQLHGTDGSTVKGEDNDRRLSFLVGLLPFMDQVGLAEMIDRQLPRVNKPDMGMDPEMGMDIQYGDGSFAAGMLVPNQGVDSLELNESSEVNELAELNEAKVAPSVWPRNGPEPFTGQYRPWMVEIPVLRCPSDPGYGPVPGSSFVSRTNYAACLGDSVLASASGPWKEVKGKFVLDAKLVQQTKAAMRGAFVPRVATCDADVTDGISHTILLGEIITSLGDGDRRSRPVVVTNANDLRDDPNLVWTLNTDRVASGLEPLYRGYHWAPLPDPQVAIESTGLSPTQRRGLRWTDGMPLYTGFNTILPPNGELVLSAKRDDCWGILPPSSRHQGGAHLAMVDGSVRFVTDSIDTGNVNAPTVYVGSASVPGSPSPYGVWGALGTRASGELSGMDLLPWE